MIPSDIEFDGDCQLKLATFIEESVCLWNLSHDAQKHVQFVIVRSRSISHNARDPKNKGRRQLLIVSPVIPGVTAILFFKKKNDKYAFQKLTDCAY